MSYTADEMMAVAAARRLRDGTVVLRRDRFAEPRREPRAPRSHAPDCVLVYESGTIGAKPAQLPLSIGDGELAETADAVVSVPEIFSYWLQAGRIDVGFLGAAQIDRFGNLNSTVIGDYDRPSVRLPGAGGAPEIAAACKEIYVMLSQSPRTFVERLDFRTTVGFGDGPGSRARARLLGRGRDRRDHRSRRPRAGSRDMRAHADRAASGRRRSSARAATGWELRVAGDAAPRRRRRPRPSSTHSARFTTLGGEHRRDATDDANRSGTVRRDSPRAPLAARRSEAAARRSCPRRSPSDGPELRRRRDRAADAISPPARGRAARSSGSSSSGRVVEEDGRPVRDTLIEIWQANAAGRYRHKVDRSEHRSTRTSTAAAAA